MSAPPLDGRDPAAIDTDLRAALPAFVPGWEPGASGPGAAVLAVAARYLRTLAEAVNAAVEKNRLAFLDLLGVSLQPAQAARVPVVFTPLDGNPDSRALARTPVAAAVPGRDQPLVFETEDAVAVTAARLAHVGTVWPGRDEYADHTARVGAGQSAGLFADRRPAPHQIYLAHATAFALHGRSVLELEITLAGPARSPLAVVWEYWDGEAWRGFRDFAATDDPADSFDGTVGLTRSGLVRLVADCAQSVPTTVAGRDGHWVRARLARAMPPDPGTDPVAVAGVRVRTLVDRSAPDGLLANAGPDGSLPESAGLRPDAVFAGRTRLDPTASLQPLGPLPRPGAVVALSSAEAFRRPGARVTIHLGVPPARDADDGSIALEPPAVAWEYWNGRFWAPLPVDALPVDVRRTGGPTTGADAGGRAEREAVVAFTATGSLVVTVPGDAAPSRLNGVDGWWWRARLVTGGYGRSRTITWTDPVSTTVNTIRVTAPSAPVLSDLRLFYVARSSWSTPDACLTYDDLTFVDRSDDLRRPGRRFPCFSPVSDRTPSLYLGFDRPLPADRVGLFVDLLGPGAGTDPEDGPARRVVARLAWDYWDGSGWPGLPVDDGTDGLQHTGVLSWIGPADSVALARFGRPLHWLRARLQEDGEPPAVAVAGLRLNAVWAAQVQTVAGEVLGQSTGEPRQSLFLRRAPVLTGETIEVRELSGARAAAELPLLLEEVAVSGGTAADVRTVTDPRTGRVTEAWVRWHVRPDLLMSAGHSRHYVVERSRGRVLFGDGARGRIPPAGATVTATSYRSGGGQAGNVPPGAVDQLLGAVPFVAAVSNPAAAEGGADGEKVTEVADRGPLILRHRYQAVSRDDYEALAREASPGVAAARALPRAVARGQAEPGGVTVLVVPRSAEPRPVPSVGLREQVRRYLAARTPAAVAGRIVVAAPSYRPVGVAAVLVPAAPDLSGPVLEATQTALAAFLHPLTGGPAGTGWPFGRGVHVSDVAVLLGSVPGLDHVTDLHLLLDDAPQGDAVEIPADALVVAGPLRLLVQAQRRRPRTVGEG